MEMKKGLPRGEALRGFTLIEILVALGIFVIILVVGSNMFFTILKSSSKTKVLTEVKQNGDYAINVMERMIRNAKEIVENTEATPLRCASEMSKLKITNPSGDTTEFDLTGPRIASNLGNYLTSDAVEIDATQSNRFDCTAGVPGTSPDVVTINFILKQAGTVSRPEEEASVSFQTTVTLRNY